MILWKTIKKISLNYPCYPFLSGTLNPVLCNSLMQWGVLVLNNITVLEGKKKRRGSVNKAWS